ncbi:MAG: peptidyl-prolyl cis-trans isomerase [Verrucomicrobiales bacterium]|nr:peptidyl-prolyl cis-trans isomerase [Verrucomicrobiales bacterium]
MAYLINGEKIDDSVIADEFESIKDHYQSMGEVVCCDRDEEFWQYARDNVINRTLLEQESNARFGVIPDEEVDARFEQLKAEHGGEQNFYDNTGFNKGDQEVIWNKLKSSMTVDRLLETEIGEIPEPTDEERKAYYEANIENYLSQEEIRVSQIFIEPSSHDAAREAYTALREVREQILDGKDFDEAAREHGSDEDRDIDLGFMKQGETMPEVEAITFSMRIGEISPIVATHYGFHLFKLTDRKEPAPIPVEEVEGITEQIVLERRNEAVEAVITDLKEKGSVEEVPEEAS